MNRAARPLLTGAVAAVLAGSGVAALALTGRGGTPSAHPPTAPAAVSTFADCDALLTHLRTKAASLVGPYGLGDQMMHVMGAREDAVAPAVGTKAGSGSGASTASALPVEQVDGVHEADLMGRTADGLLVTLTQAPPSATGSGGQVLRVTRLDPSTRRAQVLGSVRLSGFWSSSLLVSGSNAVVLGTAGSVDEVVGGAPSAAPQHSPSPATSPRPTPAAPMLLSLPRPVTPMSGRLVEFDLSDPAHPRAVRMLDVGGEVVQARSVGTQVRVAVTRSTTELPWVYPSSDSEQARDRAEQANRDLVLHADLDTWLPSATLTDLAADGTARGKPRTTRLLDCSALAAPSTFAGLGTVSLVTADLARGGLAQWDAAGLLATGTTVYATPTTTYVAATDWTPQATGAKAAAMPPKGRTQIHAFATDPAALAGGTHYLASGEVPGTLLSQWAMDEHDGVLRVASTLTNGRMVMPMEGDVASSVAGGDATVAAPDAAATPSRPATSPAPRDDNRITLLRRDGTRLEPVSVLSGFGRGESIRGVRFLGDVGYVVTYRQTDPLYTLDLRDPAHPAVLGELKLLGYSSFLQPVGPGRLLGVGRSGDADGGTTGVQVSLFDVSDPAHPRRLSAAGVLGAWSDVEADHHAFTVGDGLALTTYSRWGEVEPAGQGIAVGEPRPTAPQWTEFDAGVLAVSLDGDTLRTHLLRPLTDGPTRLRLDLGDGKGTDPAGDLAQRAVPLRTLAQDGVIWTLTDAGIAAHDATTFQRLGFTRF